MYSFPFLLVVFIIVGLVGGGVFTGVSYIGTRAISNSSTASAKLTTTTSGGTKQTSSGNAKDLTDVSSVVDEVMPSIVAITNTGTVTYNSFFGKQSKIRAAATVFAANGPNAPGFLGALCFLGFAVCWYA